MIMIMKYAISAFMIFNSFTPLYASCQTSEPGIEVALTFLNQKESRSQFKTRRVYKHSQPAYLRIVNNTSHTIPFSLHNISKPTYTHGELFELCQYNPKARATTWGLTGLVVAWPVCFPAAVIDGVCADKNNGYMESRFFLAAIGDGEIAPGEIREGFVFLTKLHPSERVYVAFPEDEGGTESRFDFSL